MFDSVDGLTFTGVASFFGVLPFSPFPSDFNLVGVLIGVFPAESVFGGVLFCFSGVLFGWTVAVTGPRMRVKGLRLFGDPRSFGFVALACFLCS